ncbi:APA family basic amino acid/polyamine antiporter [Motilibacter rhizosphaerae]|uniref:APA family basic amino acid/polyamine antiporter n=1 Tax=Motilibacter rhizosphaerae TaxID=598652 RepID=A0A4Q7NS64_9ACTN|nr:APC family permease [Motilibacter rhizosphaerae]RZS89618.1 APA family basic amino acid/polyamine antiporter [Motilibacter rhizosphaerae]
MSATPPAGLARRLGVGDAVLVGLGAMVGAGVFSAYAPAARAAGSALLVALALAAVVAWCNATSTAALAAEHPQAGGVAAAVVMTAVNYLDIRRTAVLNRVLVAVTLLCLGLVVVGALAAPGPRHALPVAHDLRAAGLHGVLQAAGLLFFAFAGYARVATLGEEVRDPRRAIPRAVPVALGLVIAVYAVVGVSVLLVLGPAATGASPVPLRDAVAAGDLPGLAGLVRVGAVTASAGVLLTAMAGVGRTALAMARDAELPTALAAVHPRFQLPHRAELVLGAVVVVAVSLADVRSAIGFSSLAVLGYDAVANAAAGIVVLAAGLAGRAVARRRG